MPVIVDLKSLPNVTAKRNFLNLDDAIVSNLQKLPRCYGRAECASKFAWGSQASAEALHCDETKVTTYREGYFRAALTEFGSMQDQLAADLVELGLSQPSVSVGASGRLLPLIFQELRNHEVHLAASPMKQSAERDMLMGNPDFPDDATPVKVRNWMLDVSETSFLSLINVARNWPSSDAKAAVAWLKLTQESWGVQELLLLAIEDYSSFLISHYSIK